MIAVITESYEQLATINMNAPCCWNMKLVGCSKILKESAAQILCEGPKDTDPRGIRVYRTAMGSQLMDSKSALLNPQEVVYSYFGTICCSVECLHLQNNILSFAIYYIQL